LNALEQQTEVTSLFKEDTWQIIAEGKKVFQKVKLQNFTFVVINHNFT